jgi:FMN phosphatase YigB (HAD superfamily)
MVTNTNKAKLAKQVAYPVVFLVDVDDTLLDNDRIQKDLQRHLESEYGQVCRDRYWVIQEDLMKKLGYRDYLGALQQYRVEHPYDVHLLAMSSFLLDYPFADRLYAKALDVLARLRTRGRTVILSDGDVVFQPRKVERSGISAAVDGEVLIYIHKEEALDDVRRRYPAGHYVLIDDKLRILDAGCCQKSLGRSGHDGLSAPGQFRKRSPNCCRLSRRRPDD